LLTYLAKRRKLENLLETFNGVTKHHERRGKAFRFKSNGSQIIVRGRPRRTESQTDPARVIFKTRQNRIVDFGEFYEDLNTEEQENFIYHFDIFQSFSIT